MTTIEKICELVGGELFCGEGSKEIAGVAALQDAGEGDASFFGNRRYADALRKTCAGVVLVPQDWEEKLSVGLIRVENPSAAFAQVVELFAPVPEKLPEGVHASAVVADSAQLGEGVCIGANVVIGEHAQIGDRTVIEPGVVIGNHVTVGADCLFYGNVTIRERCQIGDRVILQPGVVVGSDGYGFEFINGRHQKIPQVGIVQIDSDVEIGANTTIDRARFGKTWIQEGCKIDNLVQIAHNVVVGKHSLLVAQVGIAGSSRLGNYVILAGQVGVNGHIEIGDQVLVGAQSGIKDDIPAGQKWFGSPARPMREKNVSLALEKRLPRLFEKVKTLEAELEELKNQITSSETTTS